MEDPRVNQPRPFRKLKVYCERIDSVARIRRAVWWRSDTRTALVLPYLASLQQHGVAHMYDSN